MAKGQPKKRSRATYNISGLRNQSKHSFFEPIPPRSEAPSPDGDESAIDLEEEDLDLDLLPQLASDSFWFSEDKPCKWMYFSSEISLWAEPNWNSACN